MARDDDLTPHLGRIRDIGASGPKRFSRQIRRAARKVHASRSNKHYTGRHNGYGGAKARLFAFQPRKLSAMRMRRVVVKVHIARARRGAGIGAFKAHLSYIQRDGVDREGAGGDLYTSDGRDHDPNAFLNRSGQDRHQFRLIVSPEDGANLNDLKAHTREFMIRVERDFGTRLDWVAVNHFNTGHPHTHIVIRGKDQKGRDLVIAPDYITSGFRHRAIELVTEKLGPRRDVEIARAEFAQVSKDRFTAIDKNIARNLRGTLLEVERPQKTNADRFNRSLVLQRLAHLEGLGLAKEISEHEWHLSPSWGETLKELGRRGDIISMLAARHGALDSGERLTTFQPGNSQRQKLIGSLVTSLPNDELKGTRTLIVEDLDGGRWIVDAGHLGPDLLPPDGAVVEIAQKKSGIGIADRNIAQIAGVSGGSYSDALHHEFDPTASKEFRAAHIRRLEALRRKGVVQRTKSGDWIVPDNYLERVNEFEANKAGGVAIETRAWMPLDAQISHKGPTWLDETSPQPAGRIYQEAAQTRQAWLQANGWMERGQQRLTGDALAKLADAERKAIEARLANQSGRISTDLGVGEEISGAYERAFNLGNKRLALIGNEKEFTLVPWRREIERYRGRNMIVHRTQTGVSWTLGRSKNKGLSR